MMGRSMEPVAPTARVTGHEGPVMRLAVDEARGVSYSGDTLGLVRAIRLGSDPAEVWQLREPGAVYALALATLGKTDVLIAAGAYERLSIYARDDGGPRTHITLAGDSTGSVRDLAAVPQLGRLYAITQHGTLLAYELDTGKRLFAMQTNLASTQSLAARAKGDTVHLAVGTHDGRIAHYRHNNNDEPAHLQTHTPLREAVIYGTTLVSNDILIALGSDGTLLFQAAPSEPPQPLAKVAPEAFALAATADDANDVLIGGVTREISQHHLPTGERTATYATAGAPIWSLATARLNGKATVLAGDATGTILVYEN